ncbi:Isochorismatase hydrolase [Sarocladium strictum]
MSKTALLILDLQNGIMKRFSGDVSSYFSRAAEAVNAARSAGVTVIYVKTCFRAGHPDVSRTNASFERISAMGGFVEGDDSVAISSEVAPVDGDIIVTKRRVSAFTGSDLEVVLRSLGVGHLVLAGVATGGAVLSTLRQAADMDYKATVLRDLCMDRDPESHRVLLEKIFTKQAEVLDAAEWVEGLSGGGIE